MFKMLTMFMAFLKMFIELGRTSGRKLVQPILLALWLTGTYAIVHISQEGSIEGGLRSAFLDIDSDRIERRRIQTQVLMQAELRQFAAATKLIDQLLITMLERASGASRVRLNVIHNGVTGLTGTGLLRYDVTNAATTAGRLGGPTVVNQPLSEWSDFLPTLMAGKCSLNRTSDLHGLTMRARLESMGAATLLACPAADVQGKTVGAVFILWDENDPVPTGNDLETMMVEEQHLGAQIAAVLDLEGPPPWPSGRTSGD